MALIPIIIVAVMVVGLVFLLLPEKQPPTESPPESVATVFEEVVESPVVRLGERRVDETPPADVVSRDTAVPTQTNTYRNGTYTADASYYTPKRREHIISVTLLLQDDVITSADVRYDGVEAKTPSHLQFDGAYESLVLGVEVDTLDLSRVGGASLTTTAFNEALADITSDASL